MLLLNGELYYCNITAIQDVNVFLTVTYSKSIDQPGKVVNPARGQLNRKNDISLSAFAPENLVSRDGFGSPVPRQPAHLHTPAESGAFSRNSSRFPRRYPFIYTVNRHRINPKFIRSRSCVPMAFPAESPLAPGP